MIEKLTEMYGKVCSAASCEDAERLAAAVEELDADLREVHARLSVVPVDVNFENMNNGAISRLESSAFDAFVISMQCFTNILWERWAPHLRDAYFSLGRKSFARGNKMVSDILLKQALSAEPALSLFNKNEANILKRYSELVSVKTISRSLSAVPINLIWHSKMELYLIVDGKTETIQCVDKSFKKLTKAVLPSTHPHSFFKGDDGSYWLCDAKHARIIELNSDLQIKRSIRLAELSGYDLTNCLPVYGAFIKNNTYLVVYNNKNQQILFLRFNINSEKKETYVFSENEFKYVYRVFSHNGNLLLLRNGPPRCTIFKEHYDGLQMLRTLYLPTQIPCHPHYLSPVDEGYILSTANSLIRLNQDLFPIFKNDYLNTTSILSRMGEHRFARTDQDGTFVALSDKNTIKKISLQ